MNLWKFAQKFPMPITGVDLYVAAIAGDDLDSASIAWEIRKFKVWSILGNTGIESLEDSRIGISLCLSFRINREIHGSIQV